MSNPPYVHTIASVYQSKNVNAEISRTFRFDKLAHAAAAAEIVLL